MSIVWPSATVTIARFWEARWPKPVRVRCFLPARLRVLTFVTLTLKIRSHHEGVLATVGSGVALLGDDGLKNHVVSGLVNSDHLNQASFGSVLAATKASKASLVKTTYCEVITSYVLS